MIQFRLNANRMFHGNTPQNLEESHIPIISIQYPIHMPSIWCVYIYIYAIKSVACYNVFYVFYMFIVIIPYLLRNILPHILVHLKPIVHRDLLEATSLSQLLPGAEVG